MKRYIATSILALAAVTAQAQHHGYHGSHLRAPHYHHHYHGHSHSWVTPLIIGGVMGYALNRPAAQSQSVPATIYAPVTVLPPNTPERILPPAPMGYHYEQILDSGCNCHRWVLSPN